MVTKAEKIRRKRERAKQPRQTRTDTPTPIRAPRETPIIRDGWEWLIHKQRVTFAQRKAGDYYRALYRDPGDKPAIRSCLDIQEGSGGSSKAQAASMMAAWHVDAADELEVIRTAHLGDHDDLIALLNSVCGMGMTLREIAGGNERAARDLEVKLKVALDLVHGYIHPRKRAA